MTKYYLVRKNFEEYLGPLNISEFLSAYKRAEFSLHDEVAGSCGRWIAIDDVSTLKKEYPDLGRIVHEQFLGGWNIAGAKKKKHRSHSSQFAKYRNAMIAIVTLVVGGSLALRLMRSSDRGAGVTAVAEMLAQGDTAAFQEEMAAQLPTILPKATKSRRMYGEWIPYLRAFAYLKDGQIEGVSPRLLRGMDAQLPAPNDCSVAAWRTAWTQGEASFADLMAGKYFGQHAWTQILFWDVTWISRREPMSGWNEPKSYFSACLMMAVKSLEDYPNQSHIDAVTDFGLRMKNQLQKLGDSRFDGVELPNSPLLASLTCIDRAVGQAALAACESPQDMNADLVQYVSSYRKRAEIFLNLKSQSTLASDQLQSLQNLSAEVSLKDPMTGFSYQAEIGFIGAIVKLSGSIKDAVKQVQNEFPEVKFID